MSSAPTNEFPFIMTTTPNAKSFSFNISAAGKFVIDWGDGNIEKIDKNKTGKQTVSHSYNNAGTHKIKLGGKATRYDSCYTAINFHKNLDLAKIDGSLGQIFSTLSDGTQPRFGSLWYWHGTFQECTNLTGSIPENLFAGVSGAPAKAMFINTFYGCSNLTGSIPEKLFAGVSGAPAYGVFIQTFNGCSGLTGSIPEKLFAGVSGAPAEYMFTTTFKGCSGLTGSIPEKLFAGITGAPASSMFSFTFKGCSGLTGSIPENLFAGISGAPAEDMFRNTFDGCSRLTGTMDKLGNIKNNKASSAVTATKKESKPVVAPEFTPMPDMGMTGTISVDIKISGITPDDLAKIIQMACSVCNKPNIQITSDIVKHAQQNNLNQR